MNDYERLVELLIKSRMHSCEDCGFCEYEDEEHCIEKRLAGYLIYNGVTLQSRNVQKYTNMEDMILEGEC